VKARKLIVFGIGDAEDQEFRDYFSKFGEIEDHTILKDPGTM